MQGDAVVRVLGLAVDARPGCPAPPRPAGVLRLAARVAPPPHPDRPLQRGACAGRPQDQVPRDSLGGVLTVGRWCAWAGPLVCTGGGGQRAVPARQCHGGAPRGGAAARSRHRLGRATLPPDDGCAVCAVVRQLLRLLRPPDRDAQYAAAAAAAAAALAAPCDGAGALICGAPGGPALVQTTSRRAAALAAPATWKSSSSGRAGTIAGVASPRKRLKTSACSASRAIVAPARPSFPALSSRRT